MELKRTTPGAVGIAPRAILDFVNASEEKALGLHSFMLVRHGMVAAEGWWKPYAPSLVHQLFSLSKSFTSTAVGFACQEGKLSIEDDVVPFFADELKAKPCENMLKVKVKNLLTMGTGHAKEPVVFQGDKWAYNFLSSYISEEPGSLFVYNTPATYMLSRIVQKVTGEKVFDYLQPRLFEPLGIRNIWWEESPEGANTGGFGLNVHTEDIARFGLFLLNRGCVDGKQLIQPEWIDLATARHISNGDPAEDNDWTQGYGFQFWRCKPHNVYRGDGAYGQYCVVMPDQDAVLAITSGSNDLPGILKEAWKHLLPAMKDTASDEGLDELNAKLAALSFPLPEGKKPKSIASGEYALADNPLGIDRIAIELLADKARLSVSYKEHIRRLPDNVADMGYGEWLSSGERLQHMMSACAEAEDGSLICRTIQVETPFISDFIIRQDGNYASIQIKTNVGGTDMHLLGRSV